ncbi:MULTISPECIES: type II toxin-antitoxin system PemK/MazF family toxin [Cyanophyceae]|uniref:mRNA interferase n=1 Tax=Nodularia spumigena CENA596 TaxID=1819295 RepID=A0A161XMG1_NODSP|nr:MULTISPECIES: type II toxin-antitoxin system PemK/MazF family toxin [Cyanophyceae]MDB9357557.1 type II toxin-antitoxin system PemK/MazF family toxin [Nodularia spumigena CS-587/03]KZL51031.1 PemK family transcriptional regulator [Nodularia spumigena CENA596]MDB9306505.1 type II toxin-antitoxin system PemK/MazF family toxin [Nodularia spumigena CS-591/12]MDB9316882.1 type II toxin-antitoxin system PemK/MazF family toxin [Nodularia spumigena CS-590/01A]MDB9320745.1 type II toxin-antitoxin sys
MAAKRKLAQPKRGEIYLVSFDPTLGAEIQKTRPALVLQNNIANEHSPITIVAAITSQFDHPLYPTEVLVQPPEGGLTIDSVVLLNQIRSIDKQRLVKCLGKLTDETTALVNQAIQISLGLIEI